MRNDTNMLLSDAPITNSVPPLLTLVDSIPALVAYIDCNMVLQFCNQPFKEWFSIRDDVSAQPFQLVAGAEIFDQLQRHLGKVLVGQRAHFHISVHTPDGLQLLDTTLSPDFDDRKHVKGFIFHSSDISEKKRTERELKDYFENASIGLHWVNAEGIIIWANQAELQMLGYDEDEYIGQHISKFHARQPVIQDMLHRLSNKQILRNHEADLLCKDGSIRHVSINSSVLWEGDRFVHTRCFTIDITEQKLAANALKESEERFRMMANLVPLVLLTADEQGNFNFLNVRWQELTGTPAAEGLGRQWTNFIHPDDSKNVIQSWQRSISKKIAFEGKFRFRSAKNGYVASYANFQPRYSAAGKFEGYIGILQDIAIEEHVRASLEKIVLDKTDDLRRKNAELKLAEKTLLQKNEELEKINNQLSSFAHIASHDLQEPLRKIQTFLNQLFHLEGDKFSDKAKQLHQRICQSSDRMKSLIQDLLAYSKSNHNEEYAGKVELDALIREVLNELEVQIADKKAVVRISHLPSLKAIKFQFHQLFLNLLSNALKFSRPGVDPQIDIGYEIIDGINVPHAPDMEKAYHEITISDNGIGFDAESSERIFEMFHRLHSRNQYEGTGIGLAICKKIVENHQGVIVARSRPGMGATFCIYLPVAD